MMIRKGDNLSTNQNIQKVAIPLLRKIMSGYERTDSVSSKFSEPLGEDLINEEDLYDSYAEVMYGDKWDNLDRDKQSEVVDAVEGSYSLDKIKDIYSKQESVNEGSVEDELERLGIKYELSGNKYKPFKKIFKPMNKSDKFYKEFNDVVWRYNLSSAVESINEGFVEGELEKRNDVLYSVLVPGSGKTGTVEGEMLRAINRIVYRWWNDGDKFYEGYGAETAGPAHSFLVNSSNPLRGTLDSIFNKAVTSSNQGDEVYERIVELALTKVLDYIESKDGNYSKSGEDMFDYESEYESEEYSDDYGYGEYDDEDYGYDDYDGTDEDDADY
jgi:hypothetical protein